MDKAKEIYGVGKQRLVNAKRIENIYLGTIPSNAKRFFCPSCGEYVAFVRRSSKGRKSYFRHCNINETTKMCELRSVNSQQLSLYERVGLPLYLKKYSNGMFELYLAFYCIDNYKLQVGENINSYIEVESGNRKNTYFINRNNFSSSETILKKITFISNKYNIKYSSIKIKESYEKRWGNEVEGILSEGSLFSYGENGGKKIRINDDIATEIDYYYLCRETIIFRRYIDIEQEKVGQLIVDDERQAYKIYRIRFVPRNENSFNNLANLCRDIFKISLIYNPPQLIRLWPPDVIQGTDSKFINEDKQSICILNCEEENNQLYLHYNTEVNLVRGKEVDKSKYLVNIPIDTNRVSITIDREYNSTVNIQNGYLNEICELSSSIEIEDIDGEIIETGISNRVPNRRILFIKSQNKCKILHQKKNNMSLIYKINSSKGIEINNIEYGDKIISINGSIEKVLLSFQKSKNDNIKLISKFDDNKLYLLLNRQEGKIVPVPNWIDKVLIKIKIYPKTYNLVKQHMISNKIKTSTINLLWKIYKEEECKK